MGCHAVSLRVGETPGSGTALSPTLGFLSSFAWFDPDCQMVSSQRNPVQRRGKVGCCSIRS